MPMLELTLQMGTDAIETFTPVGMGGDINLARGPSPRWRSRLHDRGI